MDIEPAEARARLAARRRELEALLGGLQGSGPREALGELASYDNHPADLGTETWQRGQALGLRQDLGEALREVDAALARLEAGRYGVCEACGRPLPADRLRAVPEARRCVACEARRERAEGEPGRRAGARLRFGAALADGLDTGDAWEAVAEGGSSATQAEAEAGAPPRGAADEAGS